MVLLLLLSTCFQSGLAQKRKQYGTFPDFFPDTSLAKLVAQTLHKSVTDKQVRRNWPV